MKGRKVQMGKEMPWQWSHHGRGGSRDQVSSHRDQECLSLLCAQCCAVPCAAAAERRGREEASWEEREG